MSDYAYDQRSLMEHAAKIEEVKRAPLADRKESRDSFAEVMREDPGRVAECVEWIIEGCYGRGAMLAAERVLAAGKGANKVAMLNILVGALEWSCPAKMVAEAWKTLTRPQQEALDSAIRRVVQHHERAEHAAKARTRATSPHGMCKRSRTCLEHKRNPDVPSCKDQGKGRKTT